MRWHVAVLLVSLVATNLGDSVHAQDCTLPTAAQVAGGVEGMLESQLADGNQVINIALHEYTYTCLASGSARDKYNWMAYAANYTNVDDGVMATAMVSVL